MKRFLIALLVGGALFAAIFGAAATLDVQGGAIQVGTESDLSCDTTGVTVTFNVHHLGYVTSVNVNGIDAACAGNRLMVTLKDSNGDIIGFGGQLTEGGPPVEPASTTLFTSLNPQHDCNSTTCKIAIASCDNDLIKVTGWWGDNYGADGESIATAMVMIEGDNN